MALYYGRHKVKDYDAWRPYFDGDAHRIAASGAKLISVMRSVDDPNEVHFLFDIPDVHAFIGMLQSDETQKAMQGGGVMEQPSLYSLEEVKP